MSTARENRDQLADELQLWMRENEIPLDAGDAEEMLRGSVELTAEQRAYLSKFCRRWNAGYEQ